MEGVRGRNGGCDRTVQNLWEAGRTRGGHFTDDVQFLYWTEPSDKILSDENKSHLTIDF